MTAKIKEPIISVLSYSEYQQAIEEGKILPKYYIVDALQQYVFVHTRNRLVAYEWLKLNYPQYTMRTSRQDSGGGSGCSETSSTRRGQSKFQSDFGIPQGLR
jgi:hypothetical protein